MRIACLAFLALSVAACGSSVVAPDQTSGTTTGTGGASSGAGAAPAAGNGSAVAVGSAGVGGAGAGPSCLRTHDTVEMTLVTPDELAHGCDAGTDTDLFELTVEARVIASDDAKLTFDACAPGAMCAPTIYALTATAVGNLPYAQIDAFVTLRFRLNPFGCAVVAEIDNLPVWNGVPNPALDVPFVYLYAADGTTTTFPETPFDVEAVPLGCQPPDPGCGGLAVDDYALRFQDHAKTGEAAVVLMGDKGTIPIDFGGPGQELAFINLRSFETGECDVYTNWAFWAQPPVVVPAGR